MTETTRSLTDAISEALATGSSELNEACTCDWVVKPLLEAAGYQRLDILPQGADAAGKYPDLTILPDSPCRWFVEAKAWGVALKDEHAWQALTYAFTANGRWVVLTNGREWRLYDNSIGGEPSDKLMARVELKDVDEAARFLQAIGKRSVLEGRVEEYAAAAILARVLGQELTDPASDIVKAIRQRLRSRPGLSGVTAEQIAAFFKERRPPPPPPPTPPPAEEGYAMEELYSRSGELVRFHRPVSLHLPGSAPVPASTWVDLASETVAWLVAQCGLPPLPLGFRHGAKRCFLNSRPEHPDPQIPQKFVEIQTPAGPVFMDRDRSSEYLVWSIRALCKHMGVNPGDIRVTLAPRQDS